MFYSDKIKHCDFLDTVMKILLTNVFVEDVQRAFSFYTEILGFKKKIYMPDINLAVVVAPDEPDGTALLLEPNNAEHVKIYQKAILDRKVPVIIFGVPSVQKEYQRLKELGVVFRQTPKHTDWGIMAIFEDTCGNLVEIHEMDACSKFVEGL